MENFMIIIVLIALIYFVKNPIEKFISRKFLVSSIDNRKYGVVSSFKGGKQAVDNIARLNCFLVEFMRQMRKKYIDDPRIGEEKQRLFTLNLLERYDPDVIKENKSSGPTDTSYVLAKGKSTVFCLRETKTGNNNLHKFDILKFVALHELTHIGCNEFGHGPEFWSNFKMVLENAVSFGLYEPVDYGLYPVTYCGLDLNYNPLFDDSI